MSETEYAVLARVGKCSVDGLPTELFFPEGSSRHIVSQEAKAKLVCAECPVSNLCLQVALVNDEYGVWGGTTRKERKALGRNSKYKGIPIK
jgi:WhiB family redox-sensing transcriptional regulator